MTTQTKTIMPDRSREAKAGWRKVKLGEVADIAYGKDLPTRNLRNSGYPVYGGNGIIGYSEKYLFEKSKVIVGCRGANSGNVFLTKPKSFVTHNSLILEISQGLDLKFLFYKLFSSHIKQQVVTGSAQPQITINELEQLEFEIPNITDQKRIADILSDFDDKIELNNKISAALEQMAQAIFKEWFVNFCFPGHEKIKMVDSELGKIPEGWEVKKIKDVAKIQRGLSYSSSEISEKPIGLPMLNLANFLRGGGFNPFGIKYFSGRYKETDLVQSRDIIIAMTDLTSNREVIGHPARVPSYSHWGKILISLDVSAIKTEDVLRDFLYYLMMRKDFAFRMASSAGGTNIAHLSKSTIEDYSFVLPSGDLLEQFHGFVNPTVASKNKNETENQKLAALRDLLLPKLMSGEIRV